MRPIRLYTVVGDGRILRPRLRHKRVICTAATGPYTELLEIGLPSLRAYAKRHRFDLVAVRHDTAFGRPPAWGKIPIISRLLDSHDVVVWLDADAIIVDLSRNIADELRPGKDLYLVEHYVLPAVNVSTGVMMLRSTPWARALLTTIWGHVRYVDHPWWEQAALLDLFGYDLSYTDDGRPTSQPVRRTAWHERTQLLSYVWNCYPHWYPHALAIVNHYAGLPLDRRRAEMVTVGSGVHATS